MRLVTAVSTTFLMALITSIASAQSVPDKIVHKDVLDAATNKGATCAAFKYDPNTKTWESLIPLIIGLEVEMTPIKLPEAEAGKRLFTNNAKEEFDLIGALIATCPR